MTSYICYDDICNAVEAIYEIYNCVPSKEKLLDILESLPAIHTGKDVSKLKVVRCVKGVTINKLSQESGISIPTISMYERGFRNPRPDTMKTLAKALGVPEEMIMEDEA